MILKRNILVFTLSLLTLFACSQAPKRSIHHSKQCEEKIESGQVSPVSNQTTSSLGTINDFTYLPTTKRGVIYKKANYTQSYSAADGSSEWVAYYLTKAETEGNTERSNEFTEDPNIPGSPDKLDYNQTGYDRGHLAPAADMKMSSQSMEECFYMTNMSPQEPSFNRGIWKDLEEDVRSWAQEKGAIYVVTGALFEQDKRMKKTKIIVPSHYYKILLDANGRQPKLIAFLLPNAEGSRPMSKYAVCVDDIEQRAGIDFFSQLPDNLEDSLEKSVDLSGWCSAGGTTVTNSSQSASVSSTSGNEDLVYVCSTSKGMKYHKKDCSGLNRCKGVTISYSYEKAKKMGYSPCGTCF